MIRILEKLMLLSLLVAGLRLAILAMIDDKVLADIEEWESNYAKTSF